MLLRWEFIKENKNSTKEVIKNKRFFLVEFLFSPFSWSLSWSSSCFFLIAFLFSGFLTYLFSFINSHLRFDRWRIRWVGRAGRYMLEMPRTQKAWCKALVKVSEDGLEEGPDGFTTPHKTSVVKNYIRLGFLNNPLFLPFRTIGASVTPAACYISARRDVLMFVDKHWKAT